MTTPHEPTSGHLGQTPPGEQDPQWVKDVVSEALLHASATEAPLEPTPAVRASADWPVMATMDATSAAGARVASLDAADSVSAPPPNDDPAEVPQDLLDVLPKTLLPAGFTSAIESPAEEPPMPPPDDMVMVETDANTEGFRSSDLRTILEWMAVIIAALVVALLIKAFVLQAFWIPSESMETTVNKGDRILVNKVSYDLHEVRRGDLVVFEKLAGTPGNTKDLIKRAIALPGETIEVRDDGRIWIWGAGETPDDAKLLEEPYLDPQNELLTTPSTSDPISQDIWNERCVNQPRSPGRCTLDDESYFMMGDNRFRSSDSRSFGPIPEENIVGRAFLRIWPLGDISTL